MNVDRQEYNRLKQEFTNSAFRNKLKIELGTKCRFCDSLDAEYHHMIPLSDGGTNDLNNLIPVCSTHHKMLHGARHIHDNAKSGGRPPIPLTDDHIKAFEMYINGEIGNKKLKEIVAPKADPNKNYVPTSRKDFKKWMKSKGISKVRNTLDVSIVNAGGCLDGYPIGEILFEDGRKELIFFHDTGANDVEYVKRSYSGVTE